MQVPLIDLKAQFAPLKDELEKVELDVLGSMAYCNGPEVAKLEEELAAYCGVDHAIACSSGTDALLMSLMSLGIYRSPLDEGPADEVITTTYTFFATAGCIWRAGAKPVFVDIDPDTFNIDPTKIEAAITERTKAIIPVHLYGQMADMDAINAIAKKHNLAVIEDACQAIGAQQNDARAGSLGTTGAFSFYPTKNLSGLGEGGLVTTNDGDLAGRLKQCRNHGMEPVYYHHWVGGNFRMDSMQAAGLRVKLKSLEAWHDARAENAAFYDAALAEVAEIGTPVITENNRSIYNQYIVRVPKRDEMLAYLRENGVGCGIYYPLSMHQQPCFATLGHKEGDFPVAEKASLETIALPIFPELNEEQMTYVVDTMKAFIAKA